MPDVVPFAPGGYRFLTHQFQYSGGGERDDIGHG